MKKAWTITIPNPLALFLERRRLQVAADDWNANLPRIKSLAVSTPDGDFKWGQLVWQEIWMYIRLGNQVDPKEFWGLCERRGFTTEMSDYTRKAIIKSGLGKRLEIGCGI